MVATRFAAPQKRQDLLIEAVGLLRDRLPVKVTMIGTGGAREAGVAPPRRARARRTDRDPPVHAAGGALGDGCGGADLLCHPCEHEGVSKIILEAMMLGLPVLASDVPPLPDYVIEGETGYRVANTPEAWAARLVEIAAAQGPAAGALGPGARLRRGDLRHRARTSTATRRRFRALAGPARGAGAEARPDAPATGPAMPPRHAQ